MLASFSGGWCFLENHRRGPNVGCISRLKKAKRLYCLTKPFPIHSGGSLEEYASSEELERELPYWKELTKAAVTAGNEACRVPV